VKKKPRFLTEASPQVDFPRLEREVLAWWEGEGIVEKYLHKNDQAGKKFRFLDGPITANNPMGVHHAHGRTLKDFFQRYKNMRGYRQRFQNGFDCQGLWVEVEEEKDRGFNSKGEIEKFGLEEFSRACRSRVEKYASVQTEQSKRLGMFMDWDHSYFTMSETNNLYIWYFLKVCHERGWIYKGTDSMPWCIRCGTAISHHELSDEGYQEVEHDAVYVKFPLKERDASLLIWTTTPWTLLANVAVAVNPKLTYVEIDEGGMKLILAKSRLGVIGGNCELVREFPGRELVGASYSSPFDSLPKLRGVRHRVIPWEEVSGEEGSGLVHLAPGAGHEDYELAKIHHLELVTALDEFGVYEEGFGPYSGRNVREVPEEIISELERKGHLYRREKIVHSYPFCWRCKEELVFRTTSEWFIKVDEIRPPMKKAAAAVKWMPEYAQKRMQDWLDNMGDWPISRKRYWGLALPFYECSCGEVIVVGSKEELRERAVDPAAVDRLPELHRPWIDAVSIRCPECGEEVRRVPEVGDCWLDAGIVPFSTTGYLEDRKRWREWFPFDFITEYIAQVKLWFYATLFMSVALEDQAPWRRVLATGFIVDEKGETMHKSKGNAVWFDEAVEKMGADVMRWIYLSRDLFGQVRFGYGVGEEVRRRFQMILWHSHLFFTTFAKLDGWEPKADSRLPSSGLTPLDSWILSRLHSLIRVVTMACEEFNPVPGARAIDEFVQDLSTWYLRRSRQRVGPAVDDRADKDVFYAVMNEVLVSLCQVLAPFTPFLSEAIYQNLRREGDPESVHLCDWPEADENLIDDELEKAMARVRRAAVLGHAARHRAGIKVRQPLASASISLPGGEEVRDGFLIDLLANELNVKKVTLRGGEEKAELDVEITPDLAAEGRARELFRRLQTLRKKSGCRRDERLKRVVAPLDDLPEKWREWIRRQVLAGEIESGPEWKIEPDE
jgi:isoleucyl-tRNA synthetase